MDKEIGRIVDERFSGGLMKDDNKHGRRHVVDYALDTYNEEMKKTHMETKELDKEFRNIVISQYVNALQPERHQYLRSLQSPNPHLRRPRLFFRCHLGKNIVMTP